MVMFQPGDRVRYVGQETNRDVDATVEARPPLPFGPEHCPDCARLHQSVALRLRNGLLMFADPADCRRLA